MHKIKKQKFHLKARSLMYIIDLVLVHLRQFFYCTQWLKNQIGAIFLVNFQSQHNYLEPLFFHLYLRREKLVSLIKYFLNNL